MSVSKQPGEEAVQEQKSSETDSVQKQNLSETDSVQKQNLSETDSVQKQNLSETDSVQKQKSPETDSVQKQREVQSEEFRELYRELERESGPEPGNPEKIFARNNLEEPRTHAEEALESYRNMILERQGKQLARQNRNFLYTASSFFLVVVCVLGITTINNYRKMQEVEDVLDVMNHVESEGKRSGNENGPLVESVSSQVSPLEEEAAAQENGQKDQGAGSGEAAGQEPRPTEGEAAGQEPAQPETGEGQTGQETSGEPSGQAPDSSEGTGTDASTEPPAEDNTAQETSGGQPAEPRYYTVQPGDTLASICISIYHTKDMMGKVCEVNGIENGDKIYAGQKLLLP